MHDQIDLVLWGNENALRVDFTWPLGNVYYSSTQPQAALSTLLEQLNLSQAEAIFFFDANIGEMPSPELLCGLLRQPVDIWHCGLKLGMESYPRAAQLVAPSWMLLCNAPPDIESTSWRISLRACLVRRCVFQQIGFLAPGFSRLEYAALEWGHRCITGGMICRHTPSLVAFKKDSRFEPGKLFNFEDELRFVRYRNKSFWFSWATMRILLRYPLRAYECLQAYQKIRHDVSPVFQFDTSDDALPPVTNADPRISVILPTLGRYDYLPKCLETLFSQTIQPNEIICVDQNEPEKRRPEIYERFSDARIHVIWQDQTGQSVARNAALLQVRGDWIFFADDDSEYPPDTIANHFKTVSAFQADASTGLSLPPFPYEIPIDYRRRRVAYNLDTGNSLIRRDAILRVGGFDRHFDFGKGADTNLGIRLQLHGCLILHEPGARRLHYKAESGGLRKYGVWWETRHISWLQPWPSVTYIYSIMQYYPQGAWRESILHDLLFGMLLDFSKGAMPGWKSLLHFMQNLVRMPITFIQVIRCVRQSRRLLRIGPRLLKSTQ